MVLTRPWVDQSQGRPAEATATIQNDGHFTVKMSVLFQPLPHPTIADVQSFGDSGNAFPLSSP